MFFQQSTPNETVIEFKLRNVNAHVKANVLNTHSVVRGVVCELKIYS